MSFQAYLDNIKVKTGKKPEDFLELAKQKGLLEPGIKTMELVTWLKSDFGLGHGHAMAIVNTFKFATGPKVTADGRIDKLFGGKKAAWREPYEELLGQLENFGTDVKTATTDSYLSLLRGINKFGIIQVTGGRMDIGIKNKDAEPTTRFESAGSWNAMVTHRVRITDPKQIDVEVLKWLKRAYDKAQN